MSVEIKMATRFGFFLTWQIEKALKVIEEKINYTMSQIYLNINNQQAGPYDIEGVNQMLSANQVAPETLGWMQGMANWEAISSESFKSWGLVFNQLTIWLNQQPDNPNSSKQADR